MKDLDRKLAPVKYPARKSRIALETSGRFKFFALGRDYFLSERERFTEVEKDGVNETAYHAWLQQKNAPDTWNNKVRFLEYVDAQNTSGTIVR